MHPPTTENSKLNKYNTNELDSSSFIGSVITNKPILPLIKTINEQNNSSKYE